MSTWVALEPLSTVVDAGGEAVVYLRIRNTGDIVEEYRVDAVGDPALWCTIEPTSLRLYPGTTGSVRLTFSPPRSSDSAAGPHPYGVRVTPVETPDAVTVPEGNLSVTPFVDLRAELLPVTVRGWRRARPRLVVDNYGNTTITASVVAATSGNQIEFDIRQPSFQIPPGRASFSVLRLRPDRLLWFGQKVNHPYKTIVQPSGSEPVDVSGTYLQSALMPRWLSRLGMLLMLLAALFVALWLAAKPSVGTKAIDEPVAATGAPVTATTAPPTTPATTTPTATKAAAAPPPASTSSSPAPPPVTLPPPVGWWKLDDGSGDTAADTTGANAAAGSNIGWCTTGPCATFGGTNSQFTTARAVLDTAPGNSFTVSAWVFMTAFPAGSSFATAVSQDGAYDSGFYLQYSGTDKRWALSRVATDAQAGSAGIRALSTTTPALNTWTHLVGVFDATDNQLRLYVNGNLEGTATDPTPFNAQGDLAIGRAQFGGSATDWFDGCIGNVEVFNVPLTTPQVGKL